MICLSLVIPLTLFCTNFHTTYFMYTFIFKLFYLVTSYTSPHITHLHTTHPKCCAPLYTYISASYISVGSRVLFLRLHFTSMTTFLSSITLHSFSTCTCALVCVIPCHPSLYTLSNISHSLPFTHSLSLLQVFPVS